MRKRKMFTCYEEFKDAIVKEYFEIGFDHVQDLECVFRNTKGDVVWKRTVHLTDNFAKQHLIIRFIGDKKMPGFIARFITFDADGRHEHSRLNGTTRNNETKKEYLQGLENGYNFLIGCCLKNILRERKENGMPLRKCKYEK